MKNSQRIEYGAEEEMNMEGAAFAQSCILLKSTEQKILRICIDFIETTVLMCGHPHFII